MSQAQSLDVTKGTIWKQLLTLSLPIFISSFVQQSYGLANAWIIGQYAGKESLAAIQSTSAIIDLVVGFSVSMGVGACVIVSQYFGAHSDHNVSRAAHTAIAISLVLGIAMSVLGLLSSDWFLHAIGTPQEIFIKAKEFCSIYLAGLVFSVVFNTGAALQRAVGDTKTPSLIVALSCVINVTLDYLLVAVLKLDVLGCAIATVTTLATSALITLACLMRTSGAWKIYIRRIRIHTDIAILMLKSGIPLALQSSVYGVSNVFIQGAVNSFGSTTIAAWGLSGRIDSITWMISEALASSLITFSAQNFGAQNIKRMRQGLKTSCMLALPLIGTSALLTSILSYPIANLFIEDSQTASITSLIICYIAPFYLMYGIMVNFAATIRGAGESLRPMLLTFVGTCIFRLVWIVLFVPTHHSLEMVLLSYPVTWTLTAILFMIYYRFGHWLDHAREAEAKRLAL